MKPRLTCASVIASLFLPLALHAGTAQAAGETPHYESKPMFDNCGDPSYEKAKKEGVVLGYSELPPESWLDTKTNEAKGIDVEIQKQALAWMGVKIKRVEWMPWDSTVPSLISKRIDVIASDIHHTPERDKVISFTGPAFWYGPGIMVKKGSGVSIKSFADLKGKKVGVTAGEAADSYLKGIGVITMPFKDDLTKFQSLAQGRLDAAITDQLLWVKFKAENPNTNLEILNDVPTPRSMIDGGGFGSARYAVRKEDCSLRAAYTQALAEMTANGTTSAILRQFGLTDKNLVSFDLKP
ncbi:histidine-binding periplasmic protein [Caballeronia arvi]|uniref:Histidine-binding periplasmic protein n=1 Tax=Caballeronia arvi TaxID=1777135 RepID=A0A158HKU3_9BURK|nr:transporter substrate-binding domain-containing protein [Caballeronia arvi]SAL44250.1 histidine-binding periplasmic protein [Caballeronia arvi]